MYIYIYMNKIYNVCICIFFGGYSMMIHYTADSALWRPVSCGYLGVQLRLQMGYGNCTHRGPEKHILRGSLPCLYPWRQPQLHPQVCSVLDPESPPKTGDLEVLEVTPHLLKLPPDPWASHHPHLTGWGLRASGFGYGSQFYRRVSHSQTIWWGQPEKSTKIMWFWVPKETATRRPYNWCVRQIPPVSWLRSQLIAVGCNKKQSVLCTTILGFA